MATFIILAITASILAVINHYENSQEKKSAK